MPTHIHNIYTHTHAGMYTHINVYMHVYVYMIICDYMKSRSHK